MKNKVVEDIYKYIFLNHYHNEKWDPCVESMPIQNIIIQHLWKEGFDNLVSNIDFTDEK